MKRSLVGIAAPCLLLLSGSLRAQSGPAAIEASPVSPSNIVPAKPCAVVPGHTPLPGDPCSTVDKRAFGVLPNYRTAESSQAFSPITARQKLTIATKDSFDGPSYALAAVFSAIGQYDNANPAFRQGMKGYAKRYGTAIADQDIGNYLTEGIMPALLHEDPRYFRKGTGSIKSRIAYGATRVFVARTDKGTWTFNTAEVLGNGMAAAAGNIYYSDGRTLNDTMQRMWTQIGTDAISGVLKEFWPDVKRKWFHGRENSNAD